MQAGADSPDALEVVKALMEHESFEFNNPNTVRSVVNTFAGANLPHFHAADGSGYDFICEQTLKLDKLNPQVTLTLSLTLSLSLSLSLTLTLALSPKP